METNPLLKRNNKTSHYRIFSFFSLVQNAITKGTPDIVQDCVKKINTIHTPHTKVHHFQCVTFPSLNKELIIN